MIEVSDIHKAYGLETVLQGVSLRLAATETLSVLGKSGCGKTTLLKVLAGLEQADRGSFKVSGQEMLSLRPQAREVVYLSQEPLLFPHKDVFENVAFGLRVRKVPEAELRQRVHHLLEQLGLAAQAHKHPAALSGGQKQRTAFGRAIVFHPRVLLLDEPFGSLDAATRKEMQDLFQRLRKAEQITSIFVTHDLREALTMGDRIGRMEGGRLELFNSRQGFLAAADQQVREEIAFWKQIDTGP